jgi:predicted HTH transcriptional regulator
MRESSRIEYKRQLNGNFEKEAVAFLNSREGGVIYIGIEDSGELYGVLDVDDVQIKIKDRLKNNIQPSVMGLFDVIHEVRENKDIVRVNIAGGLEKPYYLKKYGMTGKGCFMRVGSASEPMPQKMIDELYSGRTRSSIGKIRSPRQDLTFEQLKIYYNEAGFELNDKFAADLELLTSSGEYNYAGYLLADSNGNSIKVAKYAGLDRVDLIENNEYGYCSLVKAAKYVLDKLELENPTFSRITYKKRINNRLWDHVAVREAVINALIHNDYSNGVPPKFEIFDDRQEITSAGGTILGINEDEFFDGFSNPRNQGLMRIFKDLDMVEQLGSGMPRILKAYPKECFRFTQNFLRITFPMNPDAINLLNAEDEAATKAVITDDASGSEKSSEYKINHLIGLMSENPNITTYEIADELNISTRMVEKYLSQLKEKGIIVRVGGRKTGHWEVLE